MKKLKIVSCPKIHKKFHAFESEYDIAGYDIAGYDREGYDKDGFDRDGFDRWGYDENGDSPDGSRAYWDNIDRLVDERMERF